MYDSLVACKACCLVLTCRCLRGGERLPYVREKFGVEPYFEFFKGVIFVKRFIAQNWCGKLAWDPSRGAACNRCMYFSTVTGLTGDKGEFGVSIDP